MKKNNELLEKYITRNGFLLWTICLVTLHALRSVGLGFSDVPIISMLALGFGLLKVIGTKYSKKEVLWMGILLALCLYGFMVNRDKTLIMTLLVAFGIKNCDYMKVFKVCFWSRTVLIPLRMILSAIGVLPNSYLELPKYDYNYGVTEFQIPTFGYSHPNFLFMGIISVGILFILVYGEQKKLYGYLVLTAGFYFAYKLLHCRTGFFLWVAVLSMMIIYAILKRFHLQKGFCYILSFSGIGLMTLSVIIAAIRAGAKNNVINKLDFMFAGRFKWVADWINHAYLYPFARRPVMKYDNGFFYCLHNYGYVLTILLLILACIASVYATKKGKDYAVLALTASFGYMMGEMMPISVAWNAVIVMIAALLFEREAQRIECSDNNTNAQ